ncbi:MAG: hypothetical protein JXR96_20065 [Deltaproteobacteria bacterium]|nr:hypothetical protein [Deltaproteobacteria bacterium]
MTRRSFPGCCLPLLVLICVATAPLDASANVVDWEKEIFIARPLVTEPAWTQTGFYLHSMLFDLPNAQSRPSPQIGFSFLPGFTWSALDIIELNVGFPLVVNPDETGDREIHAADLNPAIKDAPNWDGTPDFDLPGIQLGLKAKIWGKKGEDHFFVAAGLMSSIAIEKWGTNFLPPKTSPGHSNSHRFCPYVSAAYQLPGTGFAPQIQLGASIRLPEEYYDPENPPNPGDELPSNGYVDFFFNLALPFTFVFERTIPMLEINGVFGEQGSQLFITPAVSFLPETSPALLSFALMIPVLDSDFRDNEGFRLLVNFSYRLDMLSIPAIGADEDKEGDAGELPPKGW